MKYLLDAKILSDIVRHPAGPCATRLGEVGEAAVGTSIVVAAELRFGAAKRTSAALSARVEALLAAMVVQEIAPPADDVYARVRLELENRGEPIGGNDLWIAAHALVLNAVLVTNNAREFARVSGAGIGIALGKRARLAACRGAKPCPRRALRL